jgi:type IV pilus assembly protein PilO
MPDLDIKNKAVLKIVLGVVVAGGMLGAFFFTHFLPFGYQPQRDQVNTLKAEYEKKSTELARARASVADLPRFEAEYEQLHERWILAAELLPADRQFAALLRKVTLAGEQTGVTFVRFRPNAAHPETYYTQFPVEISVSGGYHQIGAFLAELANMRRIITVSDLKLTSSTQRDQGGVASAAFTASAYSLDNTNAAAKAATAATANGAPTTGTPATTANPAPKTSKGGANDDHQGS